MTVLKNPCSSALIIGCGDTGLRVAQLLRTRQVTVKGIVRSAASVQRLHAQGIDAQAHDLDASAGLPPADWVFYFAPPPADGEGDPRLRRWLAGLRQPTPRVIYISTSGIYGDCGGRWIDEDEPRKPQSARARRRLDAEDALRASALDHVILRVPGIYGPGRLPLERLQKNLPVIRPQESPYSNRIHVDDLARAAVQAASLGRSGAAYNISDGAPTTMADYFMRCAGKLGLPLPPQISHAEARRVFTPAMWSFTEESKRLLNRRMLEELDCVPQYPNLEAGLRAC